MIKPTPTSIESMMENIYKAISERCQHHITDFTVKGTEVTFYITLDQPLKFIQCEFLIEDNHEGMIFNPYLNKWSYL